MMIYAGTHGYCDPVPVDDMRQYELDVLAFIRTQHPEIGADIVAHKQTTEETEAKLRAALEEFSQTWVSPSKAEEAGEISGGDSA
jgi:F-type H+-transporting ATPase subunit alpha